MAQRVYYQNDAQFKVTSLSNEARQIVERCQQTPYGQRTILNADWTLDADGVSDYANAVGHQGLLHDFETGLVYNRARHLHVTLGVFTAPDPLGHVDGMNLYQYVRSAPTSLVDPSGLDPAVDDLTDPYGRWIGHDDVGADGWVPGIGKLSRDALIAHLYARGLRDPSKILQELERGDPAWAERVHKLAELRRIEQLLVRYADSSLWWMTTMGGAAGRGRVAPGRCVGKFTAPVSGPPASTPVGRLGQPMNVPRGTNAGTNIGGRGFGGHAIDQMQGRGVPPSAVENTIQTGTRSLDPIPGRVQYYDPVNNLTVITESDGTVVTVWGGRR